MVNNLYKKYQTEVVPALQKSLGLKSRMQAPRVVKVVVNAGIGRFIKEANFIENVEKTLAKITGQKPVRTKAKQAISNFKIRAGQEIGVMATLHGKRMYDFLEKLIKITLPRVRDFHGLPSKAFDKKGNYTIGFKENVAFPELKMEEMEKVHGLQVIINTSAATPAAGKELLVQLGFPFAKQ